NTHRHLAMGKNPLRAAYDAVGELILPVLVATLALIIVLCPVALTPGLGGFLFMPLTLAVAFAMLASFVLSLTLVPALCSNLLRGHEEAGPQGWWMRTHSHIDGFLKRLNRGYETLLFRAMQVRKPV